MGDERTMSEEAHSGSTSTFFIRIIIASIAGLGLTFWVTALITGLLGGLFLLIYTVLAAGYSGGDGPVPLLVLLFVLIVGISQVAFELVSYLSTALAGAVSARLASNGWLGVAAGTGVVMGSVKAIAHILELAFFTWLTITLLPVKGDGGPVPEIVLIVLVLAGIIAVDLAIAVGCSVSGAWLYTRR